AFGAAVGAPASPSGNVSPSSPLSVVAPPAGQSTTYCFSWVYTPGTGSAYSMVDDNVASIDSALCFTISTPVDPPANNNTGGSSTTTGGGGGGSTTTTTGGGGGGGSTTTTGGGGGSTTTTGGGGGGATKLTITRIGGADRIDTADLVSQANYANGAAGAVVLARSDLYPDSLAGTPLALGANAPILLTPPTSLDPRTAAEIQRVLPTGGTVYLLGQTSALSSDVENAVSQLGYNVVRIGGTDRFETAVDIAQALKQVSQVFVASGTNYPDALSAAAASTPTTAIVLTDGTSLPNVTNSFLGTNSSLPTWTIGGPAAQADPTPKSLVGADRYATSALVAQTFFNKPTGAGMATGLNFPDALTAGPFLARQGFPMLLTDPYTMPSSISTYLTGTQASLGQVDVFGGPAAVSNQLLSALTTLLGG
ncbi:MAG TPA: cell wall-binding repeat-containing protein, partial [Acidimicrobiales bacterium]|nr:cell wall-binding repeat-containing protein [Acidimicrobiales bacterium]